MKDKVLFFISLAQFIAVCLLAISNYYQVESKNNCLEKLLQVSKTCKNGGYVLMGNSKFVCVYSGEEGI